MLAVMSNDSLRARIESVAEVAANLTNTPDAPKYHHVVPQSYIRRWTPGRKGSVRSVRVDDGRGKLVGPKKVGGIDDFYRLEADDIDDTSTPPLVVEVLLGVFDNLARVRIDELLAAEPGPVTDVEMKADLAMVVATQMSRGQSFRQEQFDLLEYTSRQDPIEHSKVAARMWLSSTGQSLDDETIEVTAAQMREKDRRSLISKDHKPQAIQLMMQNLTKLVVPLITRNWAVYRTQTPLLTSDDPVVVIGGPSTDRRVKPGNAGAAVWIYPIDRNRLLAFFLPDISPQLPFVLDAAETYEINREIVAAAYEKVFEHPDDDIASTITVPPRPIAPRAETVIDLSRRPTRWFESGEPPPAPVSRWYQR
ncbi:hypothetical protein DBV08_00035 [Rhodococcus sp. KBW08]|nr:hypothetical protein DBV08_00035 [Rhodococcus sp. KBW08]